MLSFAISIGLAYFALTLCDFVVATRILQGYRKASASNYKESQGTTILWTIADKCNNCRNFELVQNPAENTKILRFSCEQCDLCDHCGNWLLTFNFSICSNSQYFSRLQTVKIAKRAVGFSKVDPPNNNHLAPPMTKT